MSIPMSKYVNINSFVGGASQVAQRQWCARVFTQNPLVGPNAILQFSGSTMAADVGAFFGTASEEYARALAYATYQSPIGGQPQAIQFARFVNADQPATVYGASGTAVASAATIKAITAGLLSLKFGSNTVNLTGITFASTTTYSDIAAALQTVLRANAAPELTTCTVVWNATAQRFEFAATPTGVVTESFSIIVPAGATTSNDVAAAMGLYASAGAVVNSAQVLETRVAGFNRVMALNNNCGSFCYTAASSLTLADATAIGQANAALNVVFIFRVAVNASTYAAWAAALAGIAGIGLEYENLPTAQYIEMLPMSIQAAVNYSAPNGAVGYMYKQNGAYSPSVTDKPTSDALDALRVNYYGQTMNAGRNVSFYQRGVLCGGATAPVDSTIFANEQWFKDLQQSNLMNLQLSSGQIPANRRGQTMCEAVLQSGIDAAVFNGTIMANGTLTVIQQQYITAQTNDSTAWRQVQNAGYWMATNISSAVAQSGVTEYTLNYTIIYRKDDVIKTIVGSHQLI